MYKGIGQGHATYGSWVLSRRGQLPTASPASPPSHPAVQYGLLHAYALQQYDPPVSGNNGFEFDTIAQSCDSAVDAGACAPPRKLLKMQLGRDGPSNKKLSPRTRCRWDLTEPTFAWENGMAAVNEPNGALRRARRCERRGRPRHVASCVDVTQYAVVGTRRVGRRQSIEYCRVKVL